MAVSWTTYTGSDAVGGNTKRRATLSSASSYAMDTGTGCFSGLSSSKGCALISMYNVPGNNTTNMGVFPSSTNLGLSTPSYSSITGSYNFSTQQMDTTMSVSGSGRNVYALHNYYSSTMNYRIGYRGMVTSGSSNGYYGYVIADDQEWAKLTDYDGKIYYAISVKDSSVCRMETLICTPGKRYTFSLHTYSESGCDGILISTNGSLTYSTAKVDGSANGHILSCSGSDVTVIDSWDCPSNGSQTTLYIYFRTDSSNIVAPSGSSSDVHSTGDIKLVITDTPTVTYTATLQFNGGSGGSNYFNVTAGQTYGSQLTIPTRSGFTFLGYFDSSGSSQYVSQSGYNTTAIPSNIVLYAKWQNNITNNYLSTTSAIYCSTTSGLAKVTQSSQTVTLANSSSTCSAGTLTISSPTTNTGNFTVASNKLTATVPSGTSATTYIISFTLTSPSGGNIGNGSYVGTSITVTISIPVIASYPVGGNFYPNIEQICDFPASSATISTSTITDYFDLNSAYLSLFYSGGGTGNVNVSSISGYSSQNYSSITGSSTSLSSLGTTYTNRQNITLTNTLTVNYNSIFLEYCICGYIYTNYADSYVSSMPTRSTTLSSIGLGTSVEKQTLAQKLNAYIYSMYGMSAPQATSSNYTQWTTIGDIIDFYNNGETHTATISSGYRESNHMMPSSENPTRYINTSGTVGVNVTSAGDISNATVTITNNTLSATGGSATVVVTSNNNVQDYCNWYYKYTSGSYSSRQTGYTNYDLVWRVTGVRFNNPTSGGTSYSGTLYYPSGLTLTHDNMENFVGYSGDIGYDIGTIAVIRVDDPSNVALDWSVSAGPNELEPTKYKNSTCTTVGINYTSTANYPNITIGSGFTAGDGNGITTGGSTMITCTVTNRGNWYQKYTSGYVEYYDTQNVIEDALWRIEKQCNYYSSTEQSAYSNGTTITRFHEPSSGGQSITVSGTTYTVYPSGTSVTHDSMQTTTGYDHIWIIAYNPASSNKATYNTEEHTYVYNSSNSPINKVITGYGTPTISNMGSTISASGGSTMIYAPVQNAIQYYLQYTSGYITGPHTGTEDGTSYIQLYSQTFTPGSGSASNISRFHAPSSGGTTVSGITGTVYNGFNFNQFTHDSMTTNVGTDSMVIKAYNGDDVSKTSTSTVSALNDFSLSISPNTSTIKYGEYVDITITATYDSGSTENVSDSLSVTATSGTNRINANTSNKVTITNS